MASRRPGSVSAMEGDRSAPEHRRRTAAARALLAKVIDRRARGETVPDDQLIAAHPELMPELGQELAALRQIHRAALAASKAGPLAMAPGAEEPPAMDGERGGYRPAIVGYSVLREINSGGQGTVFQGIQEATGRTVAIKVIPGGPLLGSRPRARFEREAEILARLQHPSIVGIIDRGRTADGSLFMVMEFIEGCALDEYLACRRGEESLNLPQILSLFVEIAQAVGEAHRLGVVHRDLKPSNIRVDSQGRPHILDFGLARLLVDPLEDSAARAVTQTGQIVGSLPWASPEQVRGGSDRPDERSDVYALGVMLYQALTGAFPYAVEGIIPEVVNRILYAVPKPPSLSPRLQSVELYPALDATVLKALAKSPGQRHTSAGEFAEELGACLAARPISVRRRRLRRLGMIAGLAVAMSIVSAGVYEVLARRGWWREPTWTVAQLPAITNSVGMRLVRIPPGQFHMGSPSTEQGRSSDEYLHLVTLTKPFYLGTTEVTQGQYQAVMGQLPVAQQWPGEALPVHGVCWGEAMEFCRRLGEIEGRNYRLPSEAEWEYACRAGLSMNYAGQGGLEGMGWYQANSGGQLHPVASKVSNIWGLYDMHGNVSEWCRDGYQPALPLDKTIDPVGPLGASSRNLRGGGALSPAHDCRAARRDFLHAESRVNGVGFRVVLEISDAPSGPLP